MYKEPWDLSGRTFLATTAWGPRRTAGFLSGQPDDNMQADVVGIVATLLNLVAVD